MIPPLFGKQEVGIWRVKKRFPRYGVPIRRSKLVTKYQISAINSCWEKCDEKCAYMFHVYKNQLSRQTGSRNLTDPKTLPTIWHIYMKLVTNIRFLPSIVAEKNVTTNILDGRKDGRTEGRTEVKQYTFLPSGEQGYKKKRKKKRDF